METRVIPGKRRERGIGGAAPPPTRRNGETDRGIELAGWPACTAVTKATGSLAVHTLLAGALLWWALERL